MRKRKNSVAAHGWRLVVSAVLAAVLVLGVIANSPVTAQSSKNALPPEAEKAMQRGMAAARQQQWQLAIKYFEEAVDIVAPHLSVYPVSSPALMFNLALAFDKSGGAPLPAAVWFKMYLRAEPDAANAAQVQARVDELMVTYEATVWELIRKTEELILLAWQQAAQAVDLVTPDGSDIRDVRAGEMYEAMGYTLGARAWMGDVRGANRRADRFKLGEDPRRSNWYGVRLYQAFGNALLSVGDFGGYAEARKKGSLEERDVSESIEVNVEATKQSQVKFEEIDAETMHWRLFLVDIHSVWAGYTGSSFGEKEFGYEQPGLVAVRDFPAFWERVEDEEPAELAGILGRTVYFMGAALFHFQRIETLWTKRRAEAQ